MIDNKQLKISNTFLQKYRGTIFEKALSVPVKVRRYFCTRYCLPLPVCNTYFNLVMGILLIYQLITDLCASG